MGRRARVNPCVTERALMDSKGAACAGFGRANLRSVCVRFSGRTGDGMGGWYLHPLEVLKCGLRVCWRRVRVDGLRRDREVCCDEIERATETLGAKLG